MVFVCGGCETSFQGDAKVADGPRGCWKKCSGWGLEFAGMVAMGDYSDGCICRVPVRAGQAAPEDGTAGIAASVGVITAMRERRRQASNNNMFMMH